jgi:hypothetical protein
MGPEQAGMTNEDKLEDKLKKIVQWIDPGKGVTVYLLDPQDLNVEVTGCNAELGDLSLKTRVPHMRQTISVPLGRTEVSEDFAHYTRDPERPLKRRRLMLVVNDTRPRIIY